MSFFRKQTWFLCLALLLFLSACGSQEEADESAGLIIVISAGNIFATTALTAPSGSTIIVMNNDDSPHTVTSQSAEDAFDDTGDFDAIVAAGTNTLFTLPSAPSGTIYYFYCRFYTGNMNPSSGTITIE